MTTVTVPEGPAALVAALPDRPHKLQRYLRETALLVGRSLRAVPRVPERLSDVTIQPVLFTLLFLYVFGSAIHLPGMRYQDYLLPGLIGQGLAFGVIGAGVATATDFASGVTDRFRSLPVTRLSVITAQVLGQMLEQVLGMLIVIGIGLLLGWHPHLDAPAPWSYWALFSWACSHLLGSVCFSACSCAVATPCRGSALPPCSRYRSWPARSYRSRA